MLSRVRRTVEVEGHSEKQGETIVSVGEGRKGDSENDELRKGQGR